MIQNKKTHIHRTAAWVAILLCCCIGLFSSEAETVSQKYARQVAEKFFDKAYGRQVTAPEYSYNGRRLTTGSYFAPFYLFNHPLGGFVIVSAENKMFPILGYSLTDKFDPAKMGKVQQKLLTQYAMHIEYIRYNSEPVPEAEAAWQNLDGYIDDMLKATYDATDPKISSEEASELIDLVIDSDDIYASTSDIYTPEQWAEMIDEDLSRYGSVAIGLYDDKEVVPMVVHGKKGDFYRIRLDTPDNALYRLMPSEVMNFGQIAVLGTVPELPIVPEPDLTFSFIEQILSEAEEQIAEVRGVQSDGLLPTEPIVRDFKGGHYMVHMPEGAVMSRTYSLSGAEVHHAKLDGSSVIALDISPLPTGFYFIVVYGESGRPYGLKVFR